MLRVFACCGLALGAACQPAPPATLPVSVPTTLAEAALDPPFLRFGSTGSIHGGRITTVTPSDLVTVTARGAPPVSRHVPGSHDRLRAHLLRTAPQVARSLPRDAPICMDYGTDLIEVQPPDPRIPQLSSTCPNDALGALMQALHQKIAPH